MYAQMIDLKGNIEFLTIHKVETLNKATRLWEEYFPGSGLDINIVAEDVCYDYYVNDNKVASLMKVGTIPDGFEQIHSIY
jgi:hypothetical protein